MMKSGSWYARRIKRRPVQAVRYTVQALFLLFLMYVGLRFYQFYMHFHTGGNEPFVNRPSAVEGFLPISGLVGLKVWLLSGNFDRIHPAGLTLFAFFVGSGLVFKKSFCSWFCPVGTVSEWTGKLGEKLFKKNLEVPVWLTWVLTPLKYLLLLFFLKLIVFDMDLYSAIAFLNDPYNKISDVKMLLFFLGIGGFALKFIIVMFVLSLFFKNFWCRFLCPYGALIGLGSIFGITKITRSEDTCIDCEQCTRVCPQRIKVSKKEAVLTPDCTACMLCVEACPVKDTLNMTVARKKVSKWFVPVAFLSAFILVVVIAKLTGHWNTIIAYKEFNDLINGVNSIGH